MSIRSFARSVSSDNKRLQVCVVVLGLLAVALVVGIILSSMGNSLSDRLPAALTFIGVLVTSTATIIGFFVQRLTEKRLELDAAMRAGQLITPADSASVEAPGNPAV